jgi:hypothetical protein
MAICDQSLPRNLRWDPNGSRRRTNERMIPAEDEIAIRRGTSSRGLAANASQEKTAANTPARMTLMGIEEILNGSTADRT